MHHNTQPARVHEFFHDRHTMVTELCKDCTAQEQVNAQVSSRLRALFNQIIQNRAYSFC